MLIYPEPALTPCAGAAAHGSVPSKGGNFSMAAGSHYFTSILSPLPFKSCYSPGVLSRLGLPVTWAAFFLTAFLLWWLFLLPHGKLNPFGWQLWDLCSVVLDADENNVKKSPQQALCPWLHFRALCVDHFIYYAPILKW